MSKNFAQRAKDIIAKHSGNKTAALQELDALRREQFAYEQSMSTDREIDNGVEVEMEHKPTLEFIKKYHAENGKFPTAKRMAKSIAIDHIGDMQKNPNNPGYESYYKGLIEDGLSDEVAQYKALGGFMHPMNIPESALEAMRADGGNIDIIQQYRQYADGGGIHIAPSKRGTFTAAATKHGAGVQEFASRVLANKENYSPAMVKKANFAHIFGGRNYDEGGYLEGMEYDLPDNVIQDLINKGYKIRYV